MDKKYTVCKTRIFHFLVLIEFKEFESRFCRNFQTTALAKVSDRNSFRANQNYSGLFRVNQNYSGSFRPRIHLD